MGKKWVPSESNDLALSLLKDPTVKSFSLRKDGSIKSLEKFDRTPSSDTSLRDLTEFVAGTEITEAQLYQYLMNQGLNMSIQDYEGCQLPQEALPKTFPSN